MSSPNVFTRRSFLTQSFKTSLGIALASLADVPFVVKRALADGNIGLNGKKLLFIFLRGANDGINTLIPAGDTAYGTGIRPSLAVPLDTAAGFYTTPGACFDPTAFADAYGTPRAASAATYSYANAIPTGNGFAALHPALKFLAPVYNAGHAALIHRVGYPKQSRSHFDSQNYWENGTPNNNLIKDGIFYRTMIESGLAATNPLTGVSIQSALPLILRGDQAAMTNISNVSRYALLGVPGVTGLDKSENALRGAQDFLFTPKQSRELLKLQYANLLSTLPLFEQIAALMNVNFTDDSNTDGDFPYTLFPNSNANNGGYTRPGGGTDASKYVVDTSAYNSAGTGFFQNLKAATLVLNKTDAILAGTEFGGFDTHSNQGTTAGKHPELLRRVGWAFYALRKYFLQHHDRCTWDNLVIVTLSEFGRGTFENSDSGTDHAEASVMFVGGGGIRGWNGTNRSGVFGCHTGDAVPWIPGPADQGGGVNGSLFGVSKVYLKRAVDYRSVLGELIRDHLGATQTQLGRIIPGYTNTGERLQSGGASSVDGTPIIGELNLV
jgi:uncharacterized protein (DUF1501 family)